MLFSFTQPRETRFQTWSDRFHCSAFGRRHILGFPTNRQGFCFHPGKGWSLGWEQSFQSVLVTGGIGSGKSRNLVIPNVLLLHKASLVIVDISGEIWEHTAGAKKRQGFNLWRMNFSEPESSLRYNSLDAAKHSEEGLNSLAETMMRTALHGSEKGDIWAAGGAQFLLLPLKMLTNPRVPAEYHTLANLRLLVNSVTFSDQAKLLAPLAALLSPGDRAEWTSLMDAPNQETIGSFVANAKMALRRFHSEAYARLTATTDFSLSDLRFGPRPVALYLTIREDDLEHHQILLNLLFRELFGLLSRTGEGRPVFLFLDELGNYFLHGFPKYVSLLRKHRVGFFTCCQNLQQLERLYPKAFRTIVYGSTGCRIHFREEDPDIARHLSESCGWFVGEDQRSKQPLLPPDFIRRMPKELVLIRGELPLQISLKPLVKLGRIGRLTKLTPPPVTNSSAQASARSPPLLDLDQLPELLAHQPPTAQKVKTTERDGDEIKR